MKLLYIIGNERTPTLETLIERQRQEHELVFFDLGEEQDYQRLLELIVTCDRVFSW